jgi:hypothetical protein
MARLTTAVAILASSAAVVLNGKATMIAVTRATIQPKNSSGRKVPSISRCTSPVATSAPATATRTRSAVCTLPKAPSWRGASNATLNSHRLTSTPTRATKPATTALAAPPAHSLRASTPTPTRLPELRGLTELATGRKSAVRSPSVRLLACSSGL